MGRFYSVSSYTHEYSNYTGLLWNVLEDNKADSVKTAKTLQENVKDVKFEKTLISKDEKSILAFIRKHLDEWAQDTSNYSNTYVQIMSLRGDYAIHNKDYNKKAWDKVINDYVKKMEQHHG